MAERSTESGAAMSQPVTRYARAGEVNIAYQVVGNGPVDLVWAYGLASNVEVFWEEPSLAAFLRRLSEFTRLILFDRRGCGLSDRHGTTATPTLEERTDDVLAVLDAVGSQRASILGISEGGSLAALFAATHPERTARIILYGTLTHYDADARHPAGAGDGTLAGFVEAVSRGWGMRSDWAVRTWAPSMAGDEPFTQWLAKWARQSVSRGAILPLLSAFYAYDLADVFPTVRVPTLVLHRRDDGLVPVRHGRHVASQIPDARFVELEGVDHLPFVGDADAVLAEVQDFLVGSRTPIPRRRRLLTLVFTDTAASTPRAVDLGDDAWRELLAAHDRDVRTHLTRFGGEQVKQLGNGVLAVFDGPARAIRCALGIMEASEPKGLSVRVGVHTGECEMVEADVRGIAVHVGARIVELAAPGQILVSSTVRDLVAGSGIRFGEGRDVELAGMPGDLQGLPGPAPWRQPRSRPPLGGRTDQPLPPRRRVLDHRLPGPGGHLARHQGPPRPRAPPRRTRPRVPRPRPDGGWDRGAADPAVTSGRGRARVRGPGRGGHRPGSPRPLPAPDHRVGTGARGGPGTGRRRSQCRGP